MNKKWWMGFAAVVLLIGAGVWVHRSGSDHASAPIVQGAGASAPRYHCPMHPTYTADRPGTCPICHMDLVPIESGGPPSGTEERVSDLSDRVPVFVAGDKEQWIGVRTDVVSKKELEVLVRASARVSYDPDLYAALAEHREVLSAWARAADAEGRRRAEDLLRSSRLRLAQSGLSDSQMDQMAQGGGRGLLAGGGPGLVYVQIHQDEAALIKPGQAVDLTSSALPGRVVRGRVESLDRVVDPVTRTLRARVKVTEDAAVFRPEMFLEAVIHVGLGKRLSVPKEAVIDTGTRHIVYVNTAPGHYAPRAVTLGREAEDDVEVLAGLDAGERVAVSAQFLIDSESRLKAVLGGR